MHMQSEDAYVYRLVKMCVLAETIKEEVAMKGNLMQVKRSSLHWSVPAWTDAVETLS